MATDIRVEVGGAASVRWRCPACGELIDGEAVWAESGGQTRPYHAEHAPEDVDGS